MNKSIHPIFVTLQDCLPAFPAHIRNNNPKKKESTANGWTACNTYINMASASTRWT